MQRLSKVQIDHAERRIKYSANEQKNALKNKLTTGIALTRERRATLLRQGKVKIKKSVKSINQYDNVVDVFDFSKFGTKFDDAKYQAGCKKISNEAASMLDRIILGDTEDALKIIESLKD